MSTEERIQKLQTMLTVDPNDTFVRYALAMEYNGINDPSSAIEILETLVGLDPKYVPAYHQLGIILGRLNKTQEAKKYYRKGIDIATESGEVKAEKEMREELEDLEDEW